MKAQKGLFKTRLEPDDDRGATVTTMATWRYYEKLGFDAIAQRLNLRLDKFLASLTQIDDAARCDRQAGLERANRAVAEISRKQADVLRQVDEADARDPFGQGLRQRYNELEAERESLLATVAELDLQLAAEPDRPSADQVDLGGIAVSGGQHEPGAGGVARAAVRSDPAHHPGALRHQRSDVVDHPAVRLSGRYQRHRTSGTESKSDLR
ncbi:MAG TPA: hypothetical protein VG247_20680 [Pseudonocardiaceae bacterium]|nr:hypothetical protein [Pseudonocardiaceae bacterium]